MERKLLPTPPDPGGRGETAFESGIRSWAEKRSFAFEEIKVIEHGDSLNFVNAVEDFEIADMKIRHLKRRRKLGLME